jgi:uncharacterized membrane protein
MWWLLNPLDWLALAWFFALWIAYSRFAEWKGARVPSLLSQMGRFRHDWMSTLAEREVRIGDVSILTNLSNGSTFFASTTLLILGGLLALLGTTEKVASIVADLPFTRVQPERIWDLKILLLTGIFMFAFFKFTWSLRLYHFCSVMVGGAPAIDAPPAAREVFTRRATRTVTIAAESFNNGLRAYYFSVAAITWFLNPWAWMATTAWIVLILYHREFKSQALIALSEGAVSAAPPVAGSTSSPPAPGGARPAASKDLWRG